VSGGDLEDAFLLLLRRTLNWLPLEDMSELLVRHIFSWHFALLAGVF
jgi:hypothetical protein